MARYIGAAVFTALAATISSSVTSGQRGRGASRRGRPRGGLSRASLAMAVTCVLGILLARLARRFRPAGDDGRHRRTAAAAHSLTVPPPGAPSTAPPEPARSGGPG